MTLQGLKDRAAMALLKERFENLTAQELKNILGGASQSNVTALVTAVQEGNPVRVGQVILRIVNAEAKADATTEADEIFSGNSVSIANLLRIF